jgi:DNA adenine methylase
MSQVKQSSLFPGFADEHKKPKPVNVASVPQRSPFRYPGGKTWFVPTFRKWTKQIHPEPRLLVEPFAGGGIISLTALFENAVDSVLMVELDEDIAAVWQAVVDGQSKWLARRILNFDLTREAVVGELAKTSSSARERAFQTILKNRTFHGGILAEGAGLLKHGESGKGIHSRWYPATLAKRFKNLDLIRERIEFRCENGLDTIQRHASATDTIFFIDPPYTAGGKKAGKRLYRYSELDHEKLFEICGSINGDFLLTYDNADEVRALARRHSFQMRLIPMTNTHHATMEELIIGKDLGWMDDLPAVHEPKEEYRTAKKTRKIPQ